MKPFRDLYGTVVDKDLTPGSTRPTVVNVSGVYSSVLGSPSLPLSLFPILSRFLVIFLIRFLLSIFVIECTIWSEY